MMESVSSMDSEPPAEPSNPVDDFTDPENTKGHAASSSPISKLPVELLEEIFSLTIPHYNIWVAQAPSRDEEFQRRLGWVVVTWVCRQWRNIALDYPMLWTIIPTNFTTWSLEMLERSKTAGIYVNLLEHLCSPQCRRILLPAILFNGSRVADLALQLTDYDITLDVLSYFASTPQLSQLYLEYSRRGPSVKLPNNIFLDTTRLSHLSLVGLCLGWDSHLLRGPLQKLSIINVPANARPTVAQLGCMLRNISPTLRSLQLLQALPDPHHTDTGDGPGPFHPLSENGPLFFPLLRSIDLEGEADMLAALFNAIPFGDQLGSISITTTFNNITRPHFISLLAALYRNACVTEFCTTVSQLVVRSEDIFAFRQYDLIWEQTARQGALTDFKLKQMISLGDEPSLLFVEDTFRILHWTNLRALTLDLDDLYNEAMSQLSDVLRRLFGALNGIEWLILMGTMTTKYSVEALYMDPDSIPASTEQTPFLALQSLCIRNCNFSTSAIAQTADSNRVIRMAERRVQLGFAIASIEFRNSIGLKERDMSSLERYVSEVVWGEEIDLNL